MHAIRGKRMRIVTKANRVMISTEDLFSHLYQQFGSAFHGPCVKTYQRERDLADEWL